VAEEELEEAGLGRLTWRWPRLSKLASKTGGGSLAACWRTFDWRTTAAKKLGGGETEGGAAANARTGGAALKNGNGAEG